MYGAYYMTYSWMLVYNSLWLVCLLSYCLSSPVQYRTPTDSAGVFLFLDAHEHDI